MFLIWLFTLLFTLILNGFNLYYLLIWLTTTIFYGDYRILCIYDFADKDWFFIYNYGWDIG